MTERQLKIKIGSLRRIKRDIEYYVKERTTQQNKIDKMRTDGEDEYSIKKQEEVLVETEMMLPDCQTRLREAKQDVEAFLETHTEELASCELVNEAQTLMTDVATLLA